jgi:hypothetical protein
VGSAVVFHSLLVLAPQHIAPPVRAILNIPMLAHSCGKALGWDFLGSEAADEVAEGRRCLLLGVIEVEGLGLEDAACVGEAGALRLDGQDADAALFKATVLFLYVAGPKRGRCAPRWLAAKAL